LQVTLPIFIIATSDMIPNNFDGGQTIHEWTGLPTSSRFLCRWYFVRAWKIVIVMNLNI
jgi:hypothetical protein